MRKKYIKAENLKVVEKLTDKYGSGKMSGWNGFAGWQTLMEESFTLAGCSGRTGGGSRSSCRRGVLEGALAQRLLSLLIRERPQSLLFIQ